MNKILVTGASGFVGRALLKRMGDQAVPVYRTASVVKRHPAEVVISSLGGQTDWSVALREVTVVVHAAARAHVMDDAAANPLDEYRKINVLGTLNLARQAAAVGVRRFVFVSSIKVNGEATKPGQPFTADDPAMPEDAYGQSKWEAEQGLQQIAAETGLELVIIRPPLVYGPGVKGNLRSLLKLAKSGLPLPLGAIENQRSMIHLGNLVDFIILCTMAPDAANQVFLISDARAMSTTELLRLLRVEMGLPPRLIPVPAALLAFAGRLVGKRAMIDRLYGSLQVDNSKACTMLGWTPPLSVEHGIAEMVKEFFM